MVLVIRAKMKNETMFGCLKYVMSMMSKHVMLATQIHPRVTDPMASRPCIAGMNEYTLTQNQKMVCVCAHHHHDYTNAIFGCPHEHTCHVGHTDIPPGDDSDAITPMHRWNGRVHIDPKSITIEVWRS